MAAKEFKSIAAKLLLHRRIKYFNPLLLSLKPVIKTEWKNHCASGKKEEFKTLKLSVSNFTDDKTLRIAIAKSLPATVKETTQESFFWDPASNAIVSTSPATLVKSLK